MTASVRYLRCLLSVLTALGALVVAGPTAASAPERRGAPVEGRRYHPDHVLVAFQPGTRDEGRAGVHAREGGVVENRFEHFDLDVVTVPRGEDPADVAERYERNPAVAYAHPNWEMRLASAPNDVLFGQLWGLHNNGETGGKLDADIDGPEGWDVAFGAGNFPSSGGLRVGVLDTGIDLSHIDLFGKTTACASAVTSTGLVTEGVCQDDNLHGTHVAGTIAAIANNNVGVAGVAPNSELAVFKALNSAGVGFYADVVAGIHWLHTKGGAKVISMSIGGPKDEALSRELSEAAKAGTLLVAAAGNDYDGTLNYPAAHPDVVSVAATDSKDAHADFSNCNNDVEVAAPGVGIWSTTPGNSYAPLNGTSMATPHASGVAAMTWWKNSTWSASQVRNQLVATTDDLGAGGRDDCFGYGRVNLARALGGAAPPPPPADPGAIAGKVTDARSKAGISGATVECGSAGTATTSSAGSYTIANVAPGSYTCTATASGYRPKSQSVTVASDKTTTANFALRK